MRKLIAIVWLCGVVWAVPLPAAAQPFVRDEATADEPREAPEYGYWSAGKPRLFVSTRSELGLPYAKPYVSFGYGLPHWFWTGIDVNAIATLEFIQGYIGVRATSPLLDLAFGVRDTKSFDKPFLLPAPAYTRDGVMAAPGTGARYWAWEAEAVGTVPLPHSGLVANFIVVRTLDVPGDRYLYDESYRAVVRNPMFFVLRVAAVARLLNQDALKVGVLAEHLFGTGRSHPVWRVGPAASLSLTDHLEVMAALTLNAGGPDQLGLALGAYGVAGVRYRWATGESRPELPWTGDIIP